MALVKKETPRVGITKSNTMLLSGTSLASVECLTMPLVQEIVISADIRCADCQKRVAEIISRMKETESVLVDVVEKSVTVTCRYSAVKIPSRQVTAVYRSPFFKIAMIKRFFRTSCS